jgi:hypothetical protein
MLFRKINIHSTCMYILIYCFQYYRIKIYTDICRKKYSLYAFIYFRTNILLDFIVSTRSLDTAIYIYIYVHIYIYMYTIWKYIWEHLSVYIYIISIIYVHISLDIVSTRSADKASPKASRNDWLKYARVSIYIYVYVYLNI